MRRTLKKIQQDIDDVKSAIEPQFKVIEAVNRIKKARIKNEDGSKNPDYKQSDLKYVDLIEKDLKIDPVLEIRLISLMKEKQEMVDKMVDKGLGGKKHIKKKRKSKRRKSIKKKQRKTRRKSRK
jgi:hypothetical protein